MARMAKVHRLNRYDDLDLIDGYASRFGLDPDWVFNNSAFSTVVEFAVKWKEESEYRDRFADVWEQVTTPPTK